MTATPGSPAKLTELMTRRYSDIPTDERMTEPPMIYEMETKKSPSKQADHPHYPPSLRGRNITRTNEGKTK